MTRMGSIGSIMYSYCNSCKHWYKSDGGCSRCVYFLELKEEIGKLLNGH